MSGKLSKNGMTRRSYPAPQKFQATPPILAVRLKPSLPYFPA
jgi:hypothetical protein